MTPAISMRMISESNSAPFGSRRRESLEDAPDDDATLDADGSVSVESPAVRPESESESISLAGMFICRTCAGGDGDANMDAITTVHTRKHKSAVGSGITTSEYNTRDHTTTHAATT